MSSDLPPKPAARELPNTDSDEPATPEPATAAPATVLPATAPPAIIETESASALLNFTYQELLDATKHQDDKINRLLTAIAFLTAAALALGNLDSATGIHTRFILGPGETAPLALIVLGAYLIGVIAAVVMLIASLTTPLRFPGGTKPAMPPITYADDKVEVSPIYFTEIASTSPQQWYAKWQKPPSAIALERREALIRETHNLAVRTDFKYQQTKEAVAVLTLALLSLALAVVLTLSAIAARSAGNAIGATPVPITLPTRVLLSLTLGAYVAFYLFSITRQRRQTVVERATFDTRLLSRLQNLSRTISPITAASVPAILVAVPFSATSVWRIVAVGLPLVSLVIFVLGLPWALKEEQTASLRAQWSPLGNFESLPRPLNDDSGRTKKRSEVNKRLQRLCLIAALVAVAYVLIGVTSAVTSRYWLQLLAGYAAGVVLLLAALVQSTRARRKQVRDWKGPPPGISGG